MNRRRGRKPITPALRCHHLHVMIELQELEWVKRIARIKMTTTSKYVARLIREDHRKHKPIEELKGELRMKLNKKIEKSSIREEKVRQDALKKIQEMKL